MGNIALVTGANGFIGRYIARQYKDKGYRVIGIGHGKWDFEGYSSWGIDDWYQCDITIDNLVNYAKDVDVILHCAGSGSVGFSVENPLLDFEKTVRTTYFVLEYIRRFSPTTKLIYPSSAAVYGLIEKLPIKESSKLNPISPYGVHKKMAEELCVMYAKQYGISSIIMRLFSVYGNGLQKQLLWDSCKKIGCNNDVFWGTGFESRDWICVNEVSKLMYMAIDRASVDCPVVNVATGENITIKDVVEHVFRAFGTTLVPKFNGAVNIGNPDHYCADVQNIRTWGWENETTIESGIEEYVRWYKKYE